MSNSRRLTDVPALLFAMAFPSVMAWIYFVVLPGDEAQPNSLLQAASGVGKLIQFAFPLVYVWCVWGHPRNFVRSNSQPTSERDIRTDRLWRYPAAIAFGLATAIAIFGLYFLTLRELGPFADAGTKANAWLAQLNLNTTTKYAALAAFYALVHSFGEEYYWRWFVFGLLRRWISWPLAAVISGLAFMGHHVILLNFYLPGYFWIAAVPFSLGVGVGGFVWAYLYERAKSLIAVWISHCMVDVALMNVGYDLLKGHLGS